MLKSNSNEKENTFNLLKSNKVQKNMGCGIEGCGIVGCGIKGHGIIGRGIMGHGIGVAFDNNS